MESKGAGSGSKKITWKEKVKVKEYNPYNEPSDSKAEVEKTQLKGYELTEDQEWQIEEDIRSSRGDNRSSCFSFCDRLNRGRDRKILQEKYNLADFQIDHPGNKEILEDLKSSDSFCRHVESYRQAKKSDRNVKLLNKAEIS